MERKRILTCAAVACCLALGSAAAAEKWLHVRVEDRGRNPEKVSVNVPLSVIARMLPLIRVDELQNGKLDLDIDGIEGIDLRELAAALRDAPDADFVTVESEDETVRVRKEGDFLIVRAEDRGRHSQERVRVRMPLAIVDALVGGEPDQLDLVAALDALGRFEGEPIVDIESDDSTVRVWIDRDEGGR